MKRESPLPRHTVEDLLAEVAAERTSGVLSAQRGKQRRLLCLERGKLVHVVSNVIEEQPDEYLIREGLLSPAERGQFKLAAASASKSVPALILERELVEPDRLHELLRRRCAALTADTLTWDDAEASFEPGRADLRGELKVSLPCLDLLWQHGLRHPPAIDDVRVRIGPPDTQPSTVDDAELLLKALPADRLALRVAELADGRRTVGAIVSQAGGADGAALRALNALILVGVVRTSGSARTAVSHKRATVVSRDEVLARIARAVEGDHYSVLGIAGSAKHDEIRDAYYFLARRYHPDRFRAGELRDMLGRIESFFTQVTEAYNTLSDSDSRQAYDEERSSLAAGTKEREPQQDASYLARQNFARAKLLVERRQYQDAVTFLENAVQLEPANATYHVELGRVLALNPRMRDEAEKRLLHAVNVDPARIEGYIVLGDLYERADRRAEAVEMFREVLKWEPGHLAASERLAALVGDEPSGKGRRGIFGG